MEQLELSHFAGVGMGLVNQYDYFGKLELSTKIQQQSHSWAFVQRKCTHHRDTKRHAQGLF